MRPTPSSRKFLLQPAQKIDAAVRRRIAAVEEAMHENALDLVLLRHAQQREQVLDVRMHAAVAEQAHQMQLPLASALHGGEQKLVLKKRAGAQGLVDARDVHVHHAARADIQMPDFAVSHLPFGQAHGRAGGVNQRVGIFREQPVVIGFARQGDGVALGLGAEAPAVEYGQNNRFWSLGHKSSRIHQREPRWRLRQAGTMRPHFFVH